MKLKLLGIFLIFGSLAFYFKDSLLHLIFAPRTSNALPGVSSLKRATESQPISDQTQLEIQVIAENLNIPWEIVFLPSGEMLVTERPGTLLKIGQDRHLIEEIQGVAHVGEGGLMGLALHPEFEINHWLYLYLTSRSGSGLTNRVERYRLEGNRLQDRKVILEKIPGAANHDGGRIAFGPDGYLYITTGDAQQERLAQDTNSLAGKILRLKDDGSVPTDNPFGNEVYSYGHRNPQGLTWDDNGKLWSSEHGPSGVQSGHDELNLIEKGKNYGWPVIKGDQTRPNMVTPVIHSGASDTWAPAGAVFLNGSIFFTGLRGSALYEAKLNDKQVTDLRAHFREEYGRLRVAVQGPDGWLYIATSNRDGRGAPAKNDDRILKINPRLFQN